MPTHQDFANLIWQIADLLRGPYPCDNSHRVHGGRELRAIMKGPEPPSLTAHRKRSNSTYGNYIEKDDLRHALVAEQRGLCSYCMGRIRRVANAMKIEHWRSQTRFPDEQLNYQNLLAGCLGGEGQPNHLQHCDTKKGNRDLCWNPADPKHHIETRIRYELDGAIRSDEPVFNGHLNNVLNLNVSHIKNNRKGVLTALLVWWRADKPVPRARIQHEIDQRTNGNTELSPYCQVAVWWLRQKLARMT